jgi:hypothetical protein
MFDAVPGIELEGEHKGIMTSIMAIVAQIADAYWVTGLAFKHRPVDYHGLKCMTQDMLRRILLGSDYFQLVGSSKV